MIAQDSLMQINYDTRDVIEITNPIPPYEDQDYDLLDPKDKEKFIIDLERFVRNSIEYRSLVSFLRENVNMNRCAFLNNITNENTFKIRIEIHHSPFTLRDICSTVINKRMKNGECMYIEAVAYEVIYLHYCLMIGLIPLSETVHELVHSQYIFIPVDKVYGYYKQFIEQYDVDQELLDKLYQLEQLTLEGNMNQQYKDVLEKKYIQIDMGYSEEQQVEQLHQLQTILKEKMNNFRNDINEPTNYTIDKPKTNNEPVPLFYSK